MHIIHPSEIRSLRSELMSSTALTPTQHKGKGIGLIVAIVAAIVIPIAAPAIAGAMVTSGMIASASATFASTLIGAGIGAAAAFATGGNPLIGAVGGGFGGYLGAGSIAGGGVGVDTTGIAGGTYGGTSISAAGVPYDAGSAGLMSGGGYDLGVGPVGPGSGGVGADVPLLAGAGPGAGANLGADAGAQLSGYDPSSGGAAWDTSVSTMPSDAARHIYEPTFTAAGAPAAGGPAGAPVLASGGPAGKTFGDRVGDFFGSDMTKFAGVQAGSKVLGSLMAGEPEQTELEKEQLKALQEARAAQGAAVADKTKKADKFYRLAQNVNPDFYGRMAMADELNRKKRAEMAGMRGISFRDTGARAAAQRRGALRTAKLGSFDKARADAQDRRMSLMQQATELTPTGKGYADSRAADLKASDAPYQRMLGERADWQEVAGNVGKGFFELSDEQIKKRQKKIG